MKFKIIKKEDDWKVRYHTVPIGLFNKFLHIFLIPLFTILSVGKVYAYTYFNSLEKAKEHIIKWNNGEYKGKEIWRKKK